MSVQANERHILMWLVSESKHLRLSEFLQFYSKNHFWHLSHTDALLVVTSKSWQMFIRSFMSLKVSYVHIISAFPL